MKKQKSILDQIYIASPCTVGWDEMQGNDRVRNCADCKLNVYNVSQLSRKEAENLIATTEGRLCLLLYRRTDGTLITDDCPVGLRKLRDSAKRVARFAASLVAILISFSAAKAQSPTSKGLSKSAGASNQRQAPEGTNGRPKFKATIKEVLKESWHCTAAPTKQGGTSSNQEMRAPGMFLPMPDPEATPAQLQEIELKRTFDLMKTRFGDHDERTLIALTQYADSLYEHKKKKEAQVHYQTLVQLYKKCHLLTPKQVVERSKSQ